MVEVCPEGICLFCKWCPSIMCVNPHRLPLRLRQLPVTLPVKSLLNRISVVLLPVDFYDQPSRQILDGREFYGEVNTLLYEFLFEVWQDR